MPETPSVVELLERLAQRDELIESLSAELDAARVRIAELEARLGQTSRNSSKPPSSDGLAKPAPKSLRKRGARKPGGQAGHPGSTLAPVAVPDEVITHEPGCCRHCERGLDGAVEVGREHRQVFDLPPISVRVIEHQLIARRCCCGTTTRAEAPEGVSAPVQYGPRITAIILYLYVGQFLSKKRTAAALAELFGTPVSEGTVATMTTRAATRLGGFLEWVRTNLAAAEVVNFDETGLVLISPVGAPRGRENCAWGCPPDVVVSLAREAVDQSGAGALLEGCALLLRARRSDLALPPDPGQSRLQRTRREDKDGTDATARGGRG